jgi:hypothetical protein
MYLRPHWIDTSCAHFPCSQRIHIGGKSIVLFLSAGYVPAWVPYPR